MYAVLRKSSTLHFSASVNARKCSTLKGSVKSILVTNSFVFRAADPQLGHQRRASQTDKRDCSRE